MILPPFMLSRSPAPRTIEVQDVRLRLAPDSHGIEVQWKLASAFQGRNQVKYELVLGHSATGLVEGKVPSKRFAGTSPDPRVRLRNLTLPSSKPVYAWVRVFDQDGLPSEWTLSKPIYADPEWKAKWIGGSEVAVDRTTILEKMIQIPKRMNLAVIHVCGLGQYHLYINGRKVGNEFLAPGWTDYRKTCLFQSFDVRSMLRVGQNQLRLVLANGMYSESGKRYTKFTGSYGPQKAILQLDGEHSDGTAVQVVSDDSWTARSGSITYSSIFGGEDYDARLEREGATATSALVLPAPGGELIGAAIPVPPVTIQGKKSPVSQRELRPGLFIYDLGQNASYTVRIRARGAAGSNIRVIPSELLGKDHMVDRRSSGGGSKPAQWNFTLAGNGSETYSSSFFYHGCRYLQVELSAPEGEALPVVESIEGLFVGADIERNSEFKSSNPLFNRIYTLVNWAQRSNSVSVLTDCPHRERLGWLEQAHLNGPSLRYSGDYGMLMRKIIRDMQDAQLPNGLVPDIAPEYTVFQGGFRDSPEWGSAMVLVPWQQQLFEGEIGGATVSSMFAYVDYLATKSKNGLVSHGLGEWYDLGPGAPGYAQLTPIPLTATAFLYEDARVLARITANKLTKASLLKLSQDALVREFFSDSKPRSQTSNALALLMNFAPIEKRAECLAQLVEDVETKGNTTGDVGYRYLLMALANSDRSDVIDKILNDATKPGYAYQLAHGATALTEAWDTNPTSSQNHFMLGQVTEWFYAHLAGIQPDESEPGFKCVVFRPSIVPSVKSARAKIRTWRGDVSSEWSVKGGKFTLNVLVPPSAHGKIMLPPGWTTGSDMHFEAGRQVIAIESGRHEVVANSTAK